MRLAALCGLLLALNASAQQADKQPPPGTPVTIDQLIRDLGARQWARREAACAALSKLGGRARAALTAAAKHADPEVRWRARRLLLFIAPAESFYAALERVAAGGKPACARAITEIRPLIPYLPKGTRPDPTWTVGILEEVRDQPDSGPASLNRAIDWHNLFCLLLEAGCDATKVIQTADTEYQRLPNNARANLLRSVTLWELGRKKEAHVSWKRGGGDAAGADSYWMAYDVAEWYAVRGETAKAIEKLKIAISKDVDAAQEADKASDFYRLRNVPAFEALLKKHLGAAKRPPAPELRWKRRKHPAKKD